MDWYLKTEKKMSRKTEAVFSGKKKEKDEQVME